MFINCRLSRHTWWLMTINVAWQDVYFFCEGYEWLWHWLLCLFSMRKDNIIVLLLQYRIPLRYKVFQNKKCSPELFPNAVCYIIIICNIEYCIYHQPPYISYAICYIYIYAIYLNIFRLTDIMQATAIWVKTRRHYKLLY